MIDAERFVRQILVAEIGAAGQRALGEARADVGGDGLACEVAERYARRAGFGSIAPAPAAIESGVPADWVMDASAREVLAGARAAARAIAAAVGANRGRERAGGGG